MKRSTIHRLHFLISDLKMGCLALDSGCKTVQLRNKNFSDRERLETAKALVEKARNYKSQIIINDRVDICVAAQAHGVHLGPHDIPPAIALNFLDPIHQIGVSVDNAMEAKTAEEEGATYLGAGPVYPTSSKLDAGPVLGLDQLREICTSVRIPVIGIGGITLENAEKVFDAGAYGIAVLSAIEKSTDPKDVMQRFVELVKRYDAPSF